MTEHEAPTVACATLWLDTSSETITRPAECLEDCATLAFERPAEPTSQSTAPAQPAQPAETAVLDRSQLIAAIDRHVTEPFEPAPSIARDAAPRAPVWRGVATHALAVVLGAAVSAAVLMAPHPKPAVAHVKPRFAQHVPATPSRTKAPTPPEAPPPGTAPIQASLRDAVEALARGDYAAARAEYEALAREHPHDAALSAVAAILAARDIAQCTDQERKDGSCAR